MLIKTVSLLIMRQNIIRVMIPMLVLCIGIVYYHISPINYLCIPKCPWWLLTGTYCPSCGIQRFLHLFLTGDFFNALCVNPFLLISIPYVFLAVVGKWYNINGKLDKLNRVLYSRKVLILYIILFFSWWIIRIIFNV